MITSKDVRNKRFEKAAFGYKQEEIDEFFAQLEAELDEMERERAEANNKIQVLADKVREAGGLYIIGTERHEARRIDNQLRGRSGRQGDPGESTFFLSLEDDLMRIFGGDKVTGIMDALKVDENTPIQSKMLSNIIESSQKKIEGRNFNIRKNVLNYDDVMNTQREIIYSQRQKVLDGEDVHDYIVNMINQYVVDSVDAYLLDDDIKDDWNLTGLRDHLAGILTTEDDFNYTVQELDDVNKEDIVKELTERAEAIYKKREQELGTELLHEVERVCLLKVVDTKWMAHIDDMEELKKGIGLRSYGQKNPVVEYRVEGMDMFDDMVASIREDTVRMVFTIQVRRNEEAPQREDVYKENKVHHNMTIRRKEKIGRNAPCPCGSGKKYKNCCGANKTTTAQDAKSGKDTKEKDEDKSEE